MNEIQQPTPSKVEIKNALLISVIQKTVNRMSSPAITDHLETQFYWILIRFFKNTKKDITDQSPRPMHSYAQAQKNLQIYFLETKDKDDKRWAMALNFPTGGICLFDQKIISKERCVVVAFFFANK